MIMGEIIIHASHSTLIYMRLVKLRQSKEPSLEELPAALYPKQVLLGRFSAAQLEVSKI